MFRKPVRTYEKKKGISHPHPASSMSTIIREEIPPEQIIQPPVDELSSSTDVSLEYDPFETTFDRLAKDVIEHPVPQDEVLNDSYEDSSDGAVSKKNSSSDLSDDPLLKEPLTIPALQPQSRDMKKLRNNKRQRLGPEKMSVSRKSWTNTIKRRVKAKPNTKFKDENTVPNIDLSETRNYEEKKKYSRKKRFLKKRSQMKEFTTTSSHISTKRKSLEDPNVLKRCIVNLERLSFPFDTSSNSINQKIDTRKKFRSNNNVSEDSREIDHSSAAISTTEQPTNSSYFGASTDNFEPSKNSEKRSIELSKNPLVLLWRESSSTNNHESEDSFDFGADNVDEKRTKRLKSPIVLLSNGTSNYNEQSVDSTYFGPTLNDSDLKESEEKEKTKVSKKPVVLLSRMTFMNNEQPVDSTDFGATSDSFEPKKTEEKRKTKLVKKPAAHSSREALTKNEQPVDSTDFGETSDSFKPKKIKQKRKTKLVKKPVVQSSKEVLMNKEQPVDSTDFGATSDSFEPEKNKQKRKTKLVKKPTAQPSKEALTTNERLVDSTNIEGTLDNSNAFKIEENQKANVVPNSFVSLSREASTNNAQSVDSVDFGVSSENVEPLEIQQRKRTKLFKKPVVSLSRLSLPKKVMSHFSSSTPIVTRVTTGKSSLHLSPIKSDFNEALEEPSDLGAESSAPKSNVPTADSVFTNSTSPLTMKSNEERKSVTGNRPPGILSDTPDPQPSTLMFNDTEVTEAANDQSASPKLGSYSGISHPSADSPSIGFEKESSHRETSHLIFDKTEESFRFSSSVSSHSSSICNGDNIEITENSTNDPFMGCPKEQADIPKKLSLSDKSRTSDDDWMTISGSLNISSSKSLFETRENFEQLSSGENTSGDEISEFIKTNEISNSQIVSGDNESSAKVRRFSKGETIDNSIDILGKSETSEKSSEKDSQENHRTLQAVVLLPRLTRSKINKFKKNHDSLEENLSRTTESLSQMNVDENLRVSDSVAESTNINETSSKNLESKSLNDSEESPIEMESLMVDYSSGNATEKLSVNETPDENANLSSSMWISNQEFSMQSPKNANVSSNYENEGKIEELTREEEISEASESKDSTQDEKSQNTSENNTSLHDERQDSMQPVVLLSRLNDPFRITRRRNKYRDWDFKLSAISEITVEKVSTEETEIEGVTSTPKMDDIREKLSQATTVSVRSENSQILHKISQKTNESCSTLFTPNEQNESTREDKVVYLKPGKSWARSLSILNHIHSQEDLEFLAVGKGKKWRQSVQNVLGMQQQGLIQSCVKKNEDSKELPLFTGLRNSTAWIPGSSQPDTSRLFSISSPGRFIRRVSIRVVPDCKSFEHIKDTSFLEAYGINPIENKQTSTQRGTLIDLRKTLDVIPKTLCSIKPRDVVLAQCGQKSSLSFEECYPESFLENCRKIGEGVYGEVFLYEKGEEKNVIKIIPIEGDMKINSERQKKFDEILSEIVIAKELHNLRFTDKSKTNCFVEVKKIRCVIGKYPKTLIDLWKIFDEEKNSENDCPSIFEENQLYIVLELGHGGEDLEAYVFQNSREAYALFMQTALALAVAEETLEFEHRDLHWGNLLISQTDEPQIDFKLNNKEFSVSSKGVKVSVIDFTLSRMSYQGCSIFNDLSMDEDLFVAQGEYQFDIYRLMRNKLENNWQRFEPYTNILWLHYILDKMITAARYRRKNTKVHKNGIFELQLLKDEILDYNSAVDFVTNCDKVKRLQASRTSVSIVPSSN